MQIRSSKTSPTRSRIELAVLGLLTLSTLLHAQTAETLKAVATRDQKIVRRWQLAGDPRGVAVGKDGTIYVGLAEPQSIVAVDPKTGLVKQRVVLDSAEIASTKELVTLRTNATRTRLYVANGSDESATILSLPDLAVIREITIEGQPIRDAVPDPRGRYLFLLGRRVHVYDAEGKTELRRIEMPDAMAIAASPTHLAIVGSETFNTTKVSVVALYDLETFTEITRDPLQTDRIIEGALFAANNRAFVALGRDYVYEKPLVTRGAPAKKIEGDGGAGGPMRMRIDFGDLVNSERVCMPEGSGPQIAIVGASDDLLILAERRCSASGTFAGSQRRVRQASLYGVAAYALAYDAANDTVIATDRAGFLTIYKAPRAAVVK